MEMHDPNPQGIARVQVSEPDTICMLDRRSGPKRNSSALSHSRKIGIPNS